MKKEIWEKNWSKSVEQESFYGWVKRSKKDTRGMKIRSYLSSKDMQLSGLKTIEVGSGLGSFSFAIAQEGARVTLMDFSKTALEKAGKLFNEKGLKAKLVKEDAFNLPQKYEGSFDVAMSFGTIEHYRYPKRFLLAQVHKKLVRPGGCVIISVPNRLFLPHEIYKLSAQLKGKWELGYEGAFTRGELKKLGKRLNLKDIRVYGSNLLVDLQRYFNIYKSTKLVRKFFPFLTVPPSSFHNVSFNSDGTLFDNYLGADIFLIGMVKS